MQLSREPNYWPNDLIIKHLITSKYLFISFALSHVKARSHTQNSEQIANWTPDPKTRKQEQQLSLWKLTLFTLFSVATLFCVYDNYLHCFLTDLPRPRAFCLSLALTSSNLPLPCLVNSASSSVSWTLPHSDHWIMRSLLDTVRQTVSYEDITKITGGGFL